MLPRKRLALAAILLVGLAYATMIQSFSWNQTSHYDLIRSLDKDGTTIDAYQENTGDKVYYKGHYYSARAPGLALFALPFYDTLNLVNADSWAQRIEGAARRRRDDLPDRPVGQRAAGPAAAAARVARGRALRARLRRGRGRRARPRHDGAAALDAAVLARLHRVPRLRRVRADAARARRARQARCCSRSPAWRWATRSPPSTRCSSSPLVLGLYLLSRRDAFTPLGVLRRAGAYIAGGVVGIVPLLLYNHYAFHSWTHLAYSDVPRQQKGFFGIDVPSLKVLATLLFDSRGLLTLSPVLLMGAIGTVLLLQTREARRGADDRRHLPLLRGLQLRLLPALRRRLHGPALPDHDAAVPGRPRSGIAFKRFPGPTIALAAVSIATTVIATITHPLIGYETEIVVWARYLREGLFQPTIAIGLRPRARLGRHLAVPPRRRRRRPAGGVGHPAHAPARRRARRSACSCCSRGRCSRRSRRPCWGSTTAAC